MRIAIRRELAVAILLVQSLSNSSRSENSMILADSVAFVRILKTSYFKHPVSTQLRQLYRLNLETSPLIGGPSWLPLHVKVVLKSKDICHQWDLIPIDATNTTTLQKLVTLQNVPAQIRHRIFSTSLPQNKFDQISSRQEVVRTNIYSADTLLEMSDNINMSVGDTLAPTEKRSSLNSDANSIDIDQRNISHAHRFCQSFMVRTNMELHLIWNNCWTFAVQLWLHLLVHSNNEAMIDKFRR